MSGVKLQVRRFEPGDAGGIEKLNQRLRAGGVPFPVFGEDVTRENGGGRTDPIRERLFVAAEGSEIRGAVWLREHEFWAGHNGLVTVGWAKYPVAESLIDARYRGVPASLISQLLREQPHLMALGMGGHSGAFARLLAGMGWKGTTIPLQIRIVHPTRVLRQIPHLRRSRGRRFLADLLAGSGLGWAGYKVFTSLKSTLAPPYPSDYEGEVVDELGAWTDSLWEECRGRYGFVAVRNKRMLDRLYPSSFKGLTRLRIKRAGEDVGWICLLRVDMRDTAGDDHFGRLSVGLLADCFAAPEHARGVLAVGAQYLVDADVDLIFSNQSHPAWTGALASLQFIQGPSNFAFCRSPRTEEVFGDEVVKGLGVHINRGDCDGPRWR